MNVQVVKSAFSKNQFEFVERKGIGHPDTLSDALAEHLSAEYSKYTLARFGAVLHHNFDKVGLLGGASSVRFGSGRLVKPIRVLLNGRASWRFGGTKIPVNRLLEKWARDFLKKALYLKKPSADLVFHHNLSTQSSPGKTEEGDGKSARGNWFSPRNLNDIPELHRLFSNDTSMGVGFSPFSQLELLVLKIENTLNSKAFRAKNPWIGSDIKIMGSRHNAAFMITMCIPQIADRVQTLDAYVKNLVTARQTILAIAKKAQVSDVELHINTRDDLEKGEVYLTATGSSIESGDEGLVGRGNRVQGFIAPLRPMSMEGACGKNPVYHIGKIYYVAAQAISEAIFSAFGIANEVYLVSQSGRDLTDPWLAFVKIPIDCKHSEEIKNAVALEIARIPALTKKIIRHQITIF